MDLLSRLVTPPVAGPGTKGPSLLSRPGVPGWETGTTRVSQPGQISVSVVVGINSSDKWDAIRNKIEESACSFICLQETKREYFDTSLIRNFAPRRFDCFDFIPSVGALGGLLVLWSTLTFRGVVFEKRQFSITVDFSSTHNGDCWRLTNVYGPCTEPDRSAFINWFRNCDVTNSINWLFLGDFNFYCSL